MQNPRAINTNTLSVLNRTESNLAQTKASISINAMFNANPAAHSPAYFKYFICQSLRKTTSNVLAKSAPNAAETVNIIVHSSQAAPASAGN